MYRAERREKDILTDRAPYGAFFIAGIRVKKYRQDATFSLIPSRNYCIMEIIIFNNKSRGYQMKKAIALILTLCTAAMLLAGCGSPEGSADAEKELTRGTCADNVYTSDYSNLTFTAPEGWTFSSDEEIAAMMGVGLEALEDSNLQLNEELLEQQVIYDTMALNQETGSSVIIMYENLAVSGSNNITEEDYLDTCKEQMGDADTYNYTFGDVTERQVGSDTYKGIMAELTDYGASQYYCVHKMDGYMLCIVASAFGGEDIDGIMGCFAQAAVEE